MVAWRDANWAVQLEKTTAVLSAERMAEHWAVMWAEKLVAVKVAPTGALMAD